MIRIMCFGLHWKRKIYFERVTVLYYPVLFICLLLRFEIYLFDFSHSVYTKDLKWVRKLIQKGRIKRLLIGLTPEHGVAIDIANQIIDRHPITPLQLKLSDLYEDSGIMLIQKKALANDVFKCLYIHNYFFANAQTETSPKIFCPVDYFVIYRLIAKYGGYELKDINSRIGVLRAIIPFLLLGRFIERVKLCLGLFLFLFPMPWPDRSLEIKPSEEHRDNQNVKYAVFLNDVARINEVEGKRAFDFFLDDSSLTRSNTLFIAPPDQDSKWIKDKIGKGYKFYVYKTGKKRLIELKFQAKKIFGGLGFKCCILSGLRLPVPVLLSIVAGFLYYARWFDFFRFYSLEHIIYSNRESSDQIAFNILARGKNASTHCYSSFIGGGLLYAKTKDFSESRHLIWSFLNSDVFYAVSDNVVDYYRMHYQDVREFYSVGSLYSEMVVECEREMDKDSLLLDYFPSSAGPGKKVVSYFDTSFIDDDAFATSYDDAIASYQDILRLVDDFQECLFILKPAKQESYYISFENIWASPEKGEKIVGLIEQLKNHPRVIWAGANGDIPEIMAMSDLVITHCISSPTVEALGAGKKAIWYESGEKHLGILYDQIPGLVIHGYEDLRACVTNLLNTVTEDEYQAYLSEHIRGQVVASTDGNALSRIREIITKSD